MAVSAIFWTTVSLMLLDPPWGSDGGDDRKMNEREPIDRVRARLVVKLELPGILVELH